jgi:glycine/D-amino acid oxidase-like deaminating enzyme
MTTGNSYPTARSCWEVPAIGRWKQEWTSDTAPSERIQRSLDVLLRKRLCVRARVTHRWTASVGFTPHGLPIVAAMRPHQWAIGGYHGTGNIVGALCARALVEHIYRGASERLHLLQRAELAATAHIFEHGRRER